MMGVTRAILRYLGYPDDATPDMQTAQLLQKALREVENIAQFQYRFAQFSQPFDFMLQHESYLQYMHKRTEFLLIATTLGVQIDRFLERLQQIDMGYAVIFDATASVYLENKADEFEATLPYPHRGFRFCPGYGGTPLMDNQKIGAILKAEKIGITFLDSGLMIPLKSMTGIICLSDEEISTNCSHCVAKNSCAFRERGTTCWKK